MNLTLGVIGGSGLYDLEGLTDREEVRVDTPFGAPSDAYLVGRLGGVRLCFLPRHGRGHRLIPHEINYRANVHGMLQLGVDRLLSVSAVGSMRPEIRPGDLVVVDQFIDQTRRRTASFFGDGVVGHVSLADPICAELAATLAAAAAAAVAATGGGATVHRGGTYLVIDGPQFSTRAESRLYQSWGVDVIGMTNMPEAKLAREAGLCYATLALSTDYDCWHESEDDVSVDQVVAVLKKNVDLARETIRRLAAALAAPGCACRQAAAGAVMTADAAIPAAARAQLALLLRRLP